MEPDLSGQKDLIVGAKQLGKALKADCVRVMYVAMDAEPRITEPLVQAAGPHVEIIKIESMERLGKACGIQVGAAAAGILRES